MEGDIWRNYYHLKKSVTFWVAKIPRAGWSETSEARGSWKALRSAET